MKKLLIPFVLILCVLASTGCYVTKAARIKDIVGTYQLTGYSDGEGSVIESKGVVAYLVVTSTGRGYYYYKENNVAPMINEVEMRFIPDEEETNKYSYVEYKVKDDANFIKLAYAFNGLNATQIKFKWVNGSLTSYQVNTNFKKVDKAQDLSFLQEELGELPAVIPYELGIYHGIYSDRSVGNSLDNEGIAIFNENYEDPYVYRYIDIDVTTLKATVYYMLKANEERKQETYDISFTDAGLTGLPSNSSQPATFSQFHYSGSKYSVYLKIPMVFTHEEVDYPYYENYSKQSIYFDIEYQIQQRLEWYHESNQ